MAWTTPHTFVALEVPSAANWNAWVSDNLLFLYSTPSVRVEHLGTESIPNNTLTAIPFAGEVYDTHGLHDPVTTNTRFTVPAALPGLWEFGATMRWAVNATGTRAVILVKNGTSRLGQDEKGAAATAIVHNVSTQARLVAGDYIELQAFQTSGGALTTDGTLTPVIFWMSYRGGV